MSEDQRSTGDTVPGSASAPCTLRQACVRAGLDRGGERCPTCPVRALCESELRWLVKAVPLH